MFWFIIISLTLIALIVFVANSTKLSAAKAQATYYAKAQTAREQGESLIDSIEIGLLSVQKYNFFQSLTQDDISRLSILFSGLGDVKHMGTALSIARVSSDISLLQSPQKAINLAMRIFNHTQS